MKDNEVLLVWAILLMLIIFFLLAIIFFQLKIWSLAGCPMVVSTLKPVEAKTTLLIVRSRYYKDIILLNKENIPKYYHLMKGLMNSGWKAIARKNVIEFRSY